MLPFILYIQNLVEFQVINGQPLFIVNANGFHLFALPSVFSPEGVLFEVAKWSYRKSAIKPTDSDRPVRPVTQSWDTGQPLWSCSWVVEDGLRPVNLGSDWRKRGEEGGGHMGLHPTCWDESRHLEHFFEWTQKVKEWTTSEWTC